MKPVIVLRLLFLCLIITIHASAQTTPEQDKLISVERIWDRAGHSAFTDLVYFNGKFYCAFREAATHKPDQNENCIINGSIRIIASEDAQNWTSVAHKFEKDVDLRDPKLIVTSDERLMLLFGGSTYEGTDLKSYQGRVSFFNPSNQKFKQSKNISIDESIRTGRDWLWNITWRNGAAYGVVYQGTKNKTNSQTTHLVRSTDGIHYKLVSSFELDNTHSEADVQFMSDEHMVIIIRGAPGSIGASEPPYTNWKWNSLPANLGGPELLVLGDDHLVCATREYNAGNANRTILARVTPSGEFVKLLTLPSSGDTSYSGMVIKDGILYISYYSCHEGQTSVYTANREMGAGKACIYLAKVWADRL